MNKNSLFIGYMLACYGMVFGGSDTVRLQAAIIAAAMLACRAVIELRDRRQRP